MAIPILMPKVDMVMESGTFVEWLKKEGERVEKGQPLYVISTDKAAIEVEAEYSGILSGLTAKTDDVIPVAAVIGYITQHGENIFTSSSATAIGNEVVAHSTAVRATPLARKIAREMHLDLKVVPGSGPRGRIYRADIERALQKNPQITLPAVSDLPLREGVSILPTRPIDLPMVLPNAKEKSRIVLKGAQKIVAERLAYSFSHIPHINVSAQVNMTEARRMRVMLTDSYQKRMGFGLSYTVIIAHTVSQTLALHPFLNSSFVEDTIILWEDVHLGIAADLDGNLVVPVLRSVQTKKLEELALEMHQLLEKARGKKLLPAEMSGSTFTISNLGMLGATHFTAIINPPETAILAVGQIQEIPVAIAGQINICPMMDLTLTVDHRVTNGAQVARFLADLKANLENPYRLL